MNQVKQLGRRIRRVVFLFFLLLHGVPVLCTSAEPSEDKHAEILIYYANETALDAADSESWDTIIGWLETSDNPEVSKIADQLRRDRAEFHVAVDHDVDAFQTHLTSTKGPLSVVAFTNRLVREHKYLILRPSQPPEESSIEPPASDSLVLAANPLARADMFARCLQEAADRFDPARHRFILVTKSHGNAKMAMTPRLVVPAEETNREELLAVAADEIADQDLPAWAARRIGVTKDEYFTALRDAGRRQGMQFALVFMESCHGVLDQTRIRVPENVQRLYMTGNEQTEYKNVEYADLLREFDGSVAFSQLMDDALAPKFPTLVRGEETPGTFWGSPWHVTLWWIPLAIWFAWYISRRRRITQQTP